MAVKNITTTNTNAEYHEGIQRARDDFHPNTKSTHRQSNGRTAFAAYNDKLLHQNGTFGKMPEFLPVKKKPAPVGTRKEKVAKTADQPVMQYDRYTFHKKIQE